MGVYMNWARLDPWFTVRLILHGWHPNSPLSHPTLTQRAFFGDKFPLTSVVAFQQRMNRYESYLWPFSMMRPFASAASVLRHVRRGEPKLGRVGRARVLIMAGTQDKLMTPDVTRETAAFYRAAAAGDTQGDGGGAVLMEMVEEAGHHLQNDVQWEDGAEKLWAFYKQQI